MTSTAAARHVVTTRQITTTRELFDLLPDVPDVLAWVCQGDGIVGWGELARYETSGPHRFTEAQHWWAEFTSGLRVDDEVGVPGTGPVAFTSMAFADEPAASVIVVPRLLVGRRDGIAWVTSVDGAADLPEVAPPRRPTGVRFASGQYPVADYRVAVAEAVRRIKAGDLQKVVLAHDLVATAEDAIDPRFLLRALAQAYPSCWAYAVAGLVGATPELLLRRTGHEVSARLLAGTIWPGSGTAESLLTSAKNRGEHRYGVDSLATALRPFCSTLDIPAEPSVLRLRNVAHLASEVHGTLAEDIPLLHLAAEVHPTAAVGGTPTDLAVRTIAELEGMERGRYAGPVGWIDGHGDGEFGVALRCAQLDGPEARLFAGGGIVADSDPDNEASETQAKFIPMREALQGRT